MSLEKVNILQDDTGEWNDDLIVAPAMFLGIVDRGFENQTIGREVLRHVDVLFKLIEFLSGDLLPLERQINLSREERIGHYCFL